MTQNKPAVKEDQGKNRLDLLHFIALEQVALVATFGAGRRGDHNWRTGFAYGRLFAAALRHMFSWFRGVDNDEESGYSHLAHAAWNILALLEFSLTKTGKDDRVIYPLGPEVQQHPLTSDSHLPRPEEQTASVSWPLEEVAVVAEVQKSFGQPELKKK